MSGLEQLALQTGAAVAGGAGGSVGEQIGYGIGQLTGFNKALDKRQIRQQQALTDMQSKANLALTKESYKEQQKLWDNTNLEAQTAHAKAAGLNPALLYAKGGAGGSTGSGTASVGGGQAANAAQYQQAQSKMDGLAMMKLSSEIELNKSIAAKNNADAQTTNEVRPMFKEEIVQRGYSQWLNNLRTEYENRGNQGSSMKEFHSGYGEMKIEGNSFFSQKLANEIAEQGARADNAAAQAILTNEKTKGYWKELLNDTIRADSDKIKATAYKLAAEFTTGEFTNWKTWADLARGITSDIMKFTK